MAGFVWSLGMLLEIRNLDSRLYPRSKIKPLPAKSFAYEVFS